MHAHRLLLAAGCSFLAAACGLAGAEISGRVTLPRPPVPPVSTERYDVVTMGGVMATNPPLAVVYLEGPFPPPAAPRTVQLRQKGLAFIPALLPIQVGTRVEFPNEDDVYHNIFSFSPPKRFDLGRYRPEDRPVPSQVFDRPGLVTLRCEIHNQMRGLILVLDSPYFVVTAANGRYRLPDLPAGKYVVKAWLDSATVHARPVELAGETRLEVDFP